MSLASGWLCADNNAILDDLDGRSAEVLFFFNHPHRMLVVRLSGADDAENRMFLVCTDVYKMEIAPDWLIAKLRCSKIDDDTLLIEDKENDSRITCYAARIFSEAEFKHWVGIEARGVNPADSDLQAILARSIDA